MIFEFTDFFSKHWVGREKCKNKYNSYFLQLFYFHIYSRIYFWKTWVGKKIITEDHYFFQQKQEHFVISAQDLHFSMILSLFGKMKNWKLGLVGPNFKWFTDLFRICLGREGKKYIIINFSIIFIFTFYILPKIG